MAEGRCTTGVGDLTLRNKTLRHALQSPTAIQTYIFISTYPKQVSHSTYLGYLPLLANNYIHISSALVEALGPLNVLLLVLDLTSVLEKVVFIQLDLVNVL